MVDQIRTCATCRSYDDGECWNGIGHVNSDDRCNQHMSHEEDRREDEALNRFRVSLGSPPIVRCNHE